MNTRSLNKNLIPWDEEDASSVRIATLNCMNLKNTHKDIRNDATLLKSDILILQETWQLQDEIMNYEIPGYEIHYNNIGPGKGIAVYYKKEVFQHVADISQDQMQLSKFQTIEMDIITNELCK